MRRMSQNSHYSSPPLRPPVGGTWLVRPQRAPGRALQFGAHRRKQAAPHRRRRAVVMRKVRAVLERRALARREADIPARPCAVMCQRILEEALVDARRMSRFLALSATGPQVAYRVAWRPRCIALRHPLLSSSPSARPAAVPRRPWEVLRTAAPPMRAPRATAAAPADAPQGSPVSCCIALTPTKGSPCTPDQLLCDRGNLCCGGEWSCNPTTNKWELLQGGCACMGARRVPRMLPPATRNPPTRALSPAEI